MRTIFVLENMFMRNMCCLEDTIMIIGFFLLLFLLFYDYGTFIIIGTCETVKHTMSKYLYL